MMRGIRAYRWAVDFADRRFLPLVLLVHICISASLFLHWPPPMADEEMFADASRMILEEGCLRSTLVIGLERHVYWQPPFYFLCSAAVILVGGFDLVALRLFSLLIGAAIIVLVYRLGKMLVEERYVRLGVILLACNPHFVDYVRYARMDGLCVLLMLAALLVYEHTMITEEQKGYVVCGLLLGLAILTHPLGLIAVLVVFLHVWIFRNLGSTPLSKRFLFLISPIVLCLLAWGAYI